MQFGVFVINFNEEKLNNNTKGHSLPKVWNYLDSIETVLRKASDLSALRCVGTTYGSVTNSFDRLYCFINIITKKFKCIFSFHAHEIFPWWLI